MVGGGEWWVAEGDEGVGRCTGCWLMGGVRGE